MTTRNGPVTWKALIMILVPSLGAVFTLGWAMFQNHESRPHGGAATVGEYKRVTDAVDKMREQLHQVSLDVRALTVAMEHLDRPAQATRYRDEYRRPMLSRSGQRSPASPSP